MSEEAAVIQMLVDYYAAFSTLDPQAFLPYFHDGICWTTSWTGVVR